MPYDQIKEEMNEAIPEELVKGDCDDPRMVIFHGRRIKNVEIAVTQLSDNVKTLKTNQEEMMGDLKSIIKSLQSLEKWSDKKETQNGYTEKRVSKLEAIEEKDNDKMFNLKSTILIGCIGAIMGVFGTLFVEFIKLH